MVFVCSCVCSREALFPVAFIILQLTSMMELGLAKVLGQCAVSEGGCGKFIGATSQPRRVGGSIVSPVSFCRSSLCVFQCVIGIILGLLMGTN